MDDIIFEPTSVYLGEEFFTLMGNGLNMSMMGELNFFLGLKIRQTSTRTSIFQEKYTKGLLKKFHIVDPKPIRVQSQKWENMRLIH